MMLIDKLKLRVQTGVSYPDELLAKDDLFGFAIDEMKSIVGDKSIAEPFKIDIAYYRFLLLADAQPSELDENNYKQALGALNRAPTVVVDDSTGESRTISSHIKVGQRKSEYL